MKEGWELLFPTCNLFPEIDCELLEGEDLMVCYFFCNPVVLSTELGTQQELNKYLLNFTEPAHHLHPYVWD